MIAFFALAILLSASAAILVARPLWRKEARAALTGADSNQAIYRDQFAELDRDLAAGALSPGQHVKARTELERRMLEDAAAQAAASASVATRGAASVLSGARGVAVAAGILIPAVAAALYLYLGNLHGLDAPPQEQVAPAPMSNEQFAEMTAKLAARMQANPGDATGWMMLGRAYRALDRLPDAVAAFRKAAALKADDAGLLADLAEALAMANGRTLKGEPSRLLERALKIDPSNEKALALSGSAAFERADYATAIRYWETLLKKPGMGEEMQRALSAGVAQARALAGGATAAKTSAAPVAASTLTGSVALDAALAGRAAPDDTVFIFARAAQGPRMPLAILKIKVRDLPYRFSLDDSMAMAPQMKLSAFPEVVVGARVSKSGSATPAAGDLEGSSATVQHGARGVSVVINRVMK
jgi:cytochrome c-type biogenesis protein CcmH